MPTPKIVDGVKRFQASVHPRHEELFRSLKDGQSPEVLLITCSDSALEG